MNKRDLVKEQFAALQRYNALIELKKELQGREAEMLVNTNVLNYLNEKVVNAGIDRHAVEKAASDALRNLAKESLRATEAELHRLGLMSAQGEWL